MWCGSANVVFIVCNLNINIFVQCIGFVELIKIHRNALLLLLFIDLMTHFERSFQVNRLLPRVHKCTLVKIERHSALKVYFAIWHLVCLRNTLHILLEAEMLEAFRLPKTHHDQMQKVNSIVDCISISVYNIYIGLKLNFVFIWMFFNVFHGR